MERRLPPVERVQIGNHPLHSAVLGILQQIPLEAGVVVPFRTLPELAAHEEQLLAGMRRHIPIQQPQVRELLPKISGHFIDQRTLAVHHFVVRKRQHKILGERVQHGEGHAVVVEFAVDGFVREIVQRVIHPAHVPFQREPQPAQIRRPGNRRPGRRFLGDHQHSRVPLVGHFIEPLQKGYGAQIFAAPELVGNPFARLPRVIQIKHGGHGVHAQAIDVILVHPEERAGR